MAEKVLANVVRVDFITDEDVPQLFSCTTGEEASAEPKVDEGKQNVQRSKNRIIAQNNYEDLVYGYDLKLTDMSFDPETFALVDGGTYTAVAGPPAGYNYTGPATGVSLTRTPSTVDVWTEEKDSDGEVAGYHRFRFPNAKGKPVKFDHKDGSFFVPEYNLRSRPKSGESPIKIDYFSALPEGTAAELLALPA